MASLNLWSKHRWYYRVIASVFVQVFFTHGLVTLNNDGGKVHDKLDAMGLLRYVTFFFPIDLLIIIKTTCVIDQIQICGYTNVRSLSGLLKLSSNVAMIREKDAIIIRKHQCRQLPC